MSNFVTEFSGQYIGVLNKTQSGNYSCNGAEYHLLLSAYDKVMLSIETEGAECIKKHKKEFDELLSKVQLNVKKAWRVYFPEEDYPEQNSIHGLNLVIERIKAEAEKLK